MENESVEVAVVQLQLFSFVFRATLSRNLAIVSAHMEISTNRSSVGRRETYSEMMNDNLMQAKAKQQNPSHIFRF